MGGIYRDPTARVKVIGGELDLDGSFCGNVLEDKGVGGAVPHVL
jgi:hypothetical protein